MTLFMFQADKVRLILLEEFVGIQARNPSYSMRAYAKKIGVAQSAISEILSGKRPLTKKNAEKILQGLDKDPQEIFTIFQDEKENLQPYKAIDMDAYHLIADWYYYAILSLVETEDFQSSEDWIANRLGISLKVTTDAIALLLRLDMLERDPKTKRLSVTGEHFEAISAIANSALKKACRQNIDLAQKALEETQFDERDFTAMTLCFDPQQMTEAKKMIKNFRRTFCKAMESKNKKEVYKISIQLFPLTQRGKK